MVLRRLFSGWLIAMAALARSVAQILERASEDRSASAPDPAMAALAERYPGAPAHWLAHVAERTSQLAEVGQAPLSLNSDPAAWPTMRPDGPPSRPKRAETHEARGEREPARHEPRRPPSPRRDAEVPTLAALRERSSEVWRRPEPEQRRRPRPVFAALAAAPPTDQTARPAPAQDVAHRPRSPLSLVNSSAKAQPAAPVSEAPAPRPARPEPATTWSHAHKPAERPPIDFAAARTPSNDVSERPQADHADVAAPPAARRQRAWFFAKSTSASAGRSLELSAYPDRRTASGRARGLETVAPDVAPASRPTPAYSTASQRAAAPAPEPVWRALTPRALRRSIFQTLAALRAKPRSRPDRLGTSRRAEAEPTPIDRPSPAPRPRRPAPTFTRSPAEPSTQNRPVFPPVDLEAPPGSAEDAKLPRALGETVRRAPGRPAARGEIRLPDKRSIFTPPHPSSPRAAMRRFADLPADDRWPALPPTTVTSPTGVAAAPPRFDQLAREQEEGRWSV